MTKTEAVGAPAATDALEIRDTRTGKSVYGPDRRRRDPRQRPATDQGRQRRLRPHELRPGVHEHRVVPQRDHLHRRRQGDPALSRISRSSSSPSRRASSRSRGCCGNGELPNQEQYDQWVHDITFHTYVHENIKRFLEGFPLRRAPDVDAVQQHRGAVVVLSGSEEHLRSGSAVHLDHPAAGEGADAGGVHLSAQQGAAVHLSGQRSARTRRTSCR